MYIIFIFLYGPQERYLNKNGIYFNWSNWYSEIKLWFQHRTLKLYLQYISSKKFVHTRTGKQLFAWLVTNGRD